MTAWFDIRGLKPDAPQDEKGINESRDIRKGSWSLVDNLLDSSTDQSLVLF